VFSFKKKKKSILDNWRYCASGARWQFAFARVVTLPRKNVPPTKFTFNNLADYLFISLNKKSSFQIDDPTWSMFRTLLKTALFSPNQ